MNLEKPYIVSVYAVLRNEKGEFLLLRRSENSHSNPGKWDLPGGKLIRGEPLEEAVTREVWEETGISIVPGDIAGYATFELPEKKVVALVYDGGYIVAGIKSNVCDYKPNTQSNLGQGHIAADVKLSHEHMEYAWISLDSIPEMNELPDHFKEFFKRFAMENKEPPELPI